MSRRTVLRMLLVGIFAALLVVMALILQHSTLVQNSTQSSEAGAAGSGSSRSSAQHTEIDSPPPVSPAGTGGTATTSPSGFVNGAGQGMSEPPKKAPLRAEGPENERENDPVTPIDPQAKISSEPPDRATMTILPDVSGKGSTSSSPGDFQFYEIKDLGAGTGSIIAEPSHASNGLYVLETWNWYAGISSSGGRSWTYYNPSTLFPASYNGFCCDQVVYYDQTHDLIFWILQYSPDASNNNAIRVAWAKGQAALGSAAFCYTDFTPQQLDPTSGVNYDQPKFARSDNDYYLEIMRYGNRSGSVVIRIGADQFAYPACGGVGYQYYFPGLFSPGFIQRDYGTMYFAGHVSTSVLRVFVWPESVDYTGIATHDVTHSAYPENLPAQCPRTGGSATSDWCQRRSFGGGWANSDRIFTGWHTGGALAFMWNATQGSGGQGTFNYPYVAAVRINDSSFALINEPFIWNGGVAFQYPSAALDDRLQVAGTVMYGGGSTYENCGVFIWDDLTPAPPPGWEFHPAVSSNGDTNDRLSGDYTSTRRNAYNPYSWSGSCYALQNGTDNAHIHPYYLWFGRARDYLSWLSVFLPYLHK